MAVRIGTAADAPILAAAWNSSQPIIAARWPVERGGPAAIVPLTAATFARMFGNPAFRCWISDQADRGQINGAGFLCYQQTDHVFEIVTAILRRTTGTALAQRVANRRRLRMTLHDGLIAMTTGAPAAMPIDTGYPEPVADDEVLTLMEVMDFMAARNGRTPTIDRGLRTWPGLTVGDVATGLAGFTP